MIRRLLARGAWSALIGGCVTLAWAQGSAEPSPTPSSPSVLRNCKVDLIDEVDLPAQIPGVLKELNVKVEMPVKQGQKLGQIEDAELQDEKIIAQREYEAAKVDSDNDVNKRFAEASTAVALAEWWTAYNANKRSPNAIPLTEMQKLQHSHTRAKLSIEQAARDLEKFAAVTLQKQAQHKAVDTKIARTQLLAPFDGVVAEVPVHQSEWVNPGDKVCRIIRLDRLYVKGRVSVDDFSPDQLRGRSVKVSLDLAHGQRESFDGTITVVHPEVSLDGRRYEIWAEVQNRQVGGEWLMRPGMEAQMNIDVGAPGPASAQLGANP